MQIPCNASIELNIWIMAIFTSFTYSITLQNRKVTLVTIFHILIKGLIILKGPKATFMLLIIVILNMDVCTFIIDDHNTLITICLTTPSSLRYKIKPSHPLNGCWLIHHILQTSSNLKIHDTLKLIHPMLCKLHVQLNH
jgi:hypothetical protein